MPSKNRRETQNRNPKGRYFEMPHSILTTEKYARLSGWAVKLIADLMIQWNGRNNGDLCASWSVMKSRGWRSKSTLHEATNELLASGYIMITRVGGRNKPHLFAVTWHEVHECRDRYTGKHKLDMEPTTVAPGFWKDEVQE